MTESGDFSTKTYSNLITAAKPVQMWAKWIWHPILRPNITSFLWKLLRHTIPIDCRVCTRGVHLVSRCRCCSAPNEESLVHLFIQFEIAAEVWKCFGLIFRLPFKFQSILHAMKTWMNIPTSPSQFDVGIMVTAAPT